MIPLKLKLNIVLLLIFHWASGQNNSSNTAIKSNYRYDTDLLTKEFHAGRRAALRKELPPNALAVFFSNPVRNRSGDTDFEFHQDPNFYYLSGHTEPNSILLVFSEMQELNGQNFNEILFLEERTSSKELWTGRILGTSEAKKILGIQMILKNTEFQNFQLSLDKLEAIYMAPLLAVDAEEGAAIDLLSMQNRFTTMLAESGKSNIHSGALNTIMSKLREVKQAEEIALMRKAINISCKAHLELMKALDSGMNEYQAQAILEYVFKNEGAEAPGYPSIVGSGENSCILHYSSNRKK
ncbi:MAG: aminopeptidase P N-terminal domain-containing protein [Bacteroidetes bacterium]|nr:aminopeptidase P N-terminal domain-containing protein [Bacteroidota bacterium]